jgi:HAD superfamily hydrolase (TIGR01549 family)
MARVNDSAGGGPHALLLDLDGTIADTLPLIFDTFRHAIEPWVDRKLTDAEVEACFGPAEPECLANMVPREAVGEATDRFFRFYEENHARAVKMVDGLHRAIDHARSLGWKVGVFTGKGRRSATFSLKELGLLGDMECLISGDDVSRPKPHGEGIFRASARLGVAVPRILMAGDSPADVQAARMAGASCAAVAWAAFLPERLQAARPDWICQTIDDLIAAIDEMARR